MWSVLQKFPSDCVQRMICKGPGMEVEQLGRSVVEFRQKIMVDKDGKYADRK